MLWSEILHASRLHVHCQPAKSQPMIHLSRDIAGLRYLFGHTMSMSQCVRWARSVRHPTPTVRKKCRWIKGRNNHISSLRGLKVTLWVMSVLSDLSDLRDLKCFKWFRSFKWFKCFRWFNWFRCVKYFRWFIRKVTLRPPPDGSCPFCAFYFLLF